MATMARLEGVLTEMVARAIDAVLAAKLPEMEEAARAAVERGVERALREQNGAAPIPATPASAPASAPAPVAARATRRPSPGRRARRELPPNFYVVPGPPRRPRKPSSRRSDAQLEELTASLLQQIRETPGMTSEALMEALGTKGVATTTREVRLPLQRLQRDRTIHHRGNKRFTRYYPRT